MSSCSAGASSPGTPGRRPPRGAPGPRAPRGGAGALGDRPPAGPGAAADEAYPARLEARLRREGFDYRVVNAGVSGDTAAAGLRRLDWVLRAAPEVVIVALRANDGLPGPDPRAPA